MGEDLTPLLTPTQGNVEELLDARIRPFPVYTVVQRRRGASGNGRIRIRKPMLYPPELQGRAGYNTVERLGGYHRGPLQTIVSPVTTPAPLPSRPKILPPPLPPLQTIPLAMTPATTSGRRRPATLVYPGPGANQRRRLTRWDSTC